jgi:hypothetical protein
MSYTPIGNALSNAPKRGQIKNDIDFGVCLQGFHPCTPQRVVTL